MEENLLRWDLRDSWEKQITADLTFVCGITQLYYVLQVTCLWNTSKLIKDNKNLPV